LNDKKNDDKIHAGLWLLVNIFIHNNQPKACRKGGGGNEKEVRAVWTMGDGVIPLFWGQFIK